VRNGDFSAGTDEWLPWDNIDYSVNGSNQLELFAPVGHPNAILYQNLDYQAQTGMPFELTFELGNSGPTAKETWVTLRNVAWTDWFNCHFVLPAGTPLDTYTIRGKTTATWPNMRYEMWVGPADGQPALVVDNVSVQYKPGLVLTQAECIPPGGAPGEALPEITPTPEPTIEPTAAPAIQVVESDDPRVAQSGAWTAHDTDLASGGSYIFSSGSADDTLSLSFSGTQIAVVYVEHPALGVFAVEVDGAVMQTVDSAAEAAAFGALVEVSGLEAGIHVVRIVLVSGTVAIDAFVVTDMVESPVEPTPVPTEVVPTETPTVEPTIEPTVEPTVTPAEALETIESDDARVTQNGAWTLTAGDLASGGVYLFSSGGVDDTLALIFTGPRVDVVYVKHPALGLFSIEIDGAVLYTVDSAGEATFGASVALNGLGDGLHTLRIVPVSGTVAIDAFVVAPQGEVPVVVPTIEPTEIAPTEVVPTATPEPPTVEPTTTPVPTELPPTDMPDPTEAPVTPGGPSRPETGP